MHNYTFFGRRDKLLTNDKTGPFRTADKPSGSAMPLPTTLLFLEYSILTASCASAVN
jgi:hypothetical protein